eukprot:SM000006S19338  [mRNA]  locus=s6:150197:151698:- [translate_table: standard]
MRHRLNSEGKREGKVISYKRSELRAVELMEGLCKRLRGHYLRDVLPQPLSLLLHQLQVQARGAARLLTGLATRWSRWEKADRENGQIWSCRRKSSLTKVLVWLGGGPAKAVREVQGKELEKWCDKLLEEIESDLTEAIKSGHLEKTDVEEELCTMMTDLCNKPDPPVRSKSKKLITSNSPDPRELEGASNDEL